MSTQKSTWEKNIIIGSNIYIFQKCMNNPVNETLLPQKSIKENCENKHKLLLQYTISGNKMLVEEMLKQHAVIGIRDENCLTPLHISIAKNHREIFDLLLERGADIGALSRRDIRPIYTAAEFNRADMLETILDKDASQIWTRDGYDSLPIHVAAYKGHTECLEKLIKKLPKDELDRGINARNLFGLTPLFCAAQNDQLLAVCLLLNNGANPNIEQQFGFRPLHSTAVTGNVPITEELIKAKCEIDPISIDKSTPLYLASRTGNKGIVKLLLGENANVNMKGPGGNTPLHVACAGNHSEVVEVLLANQKIEINSVNDNGESPLHISASYGSVSASRLLIEKHCDLDGVGPEGDTPLHSAIRSGQKEIVQLLIEAGAKTDIPDSKGETASVLLKNSHFIDISSLNAGKGDQSLKDAPRAGGSKAGNQILEKTIQSQIPEDNQEQPKFYLKKYSQFEIQNLFKAIEENDFKHFELNIKPEYDLNFTNEFNSTLLHSVVKNKNLIFLKFILNFNIDLNIKDNNGETVLALILHDAVFWFKNNKKPCKDALKKIIELTEDLNVQNEDGDTILHYVVRYRNLELIDILTKLKFDVNIESNKNITPFDLVLENREFWFENDNEVKIKFMKTILNSLEDINSRYGYDKSTVLHWASECDNAELIHFLFERGALLNVCYFIGNTPLHTSSQNNCLNASEALINLGANVNQKDKNGRQPIHWAARGGHVPIVDLLIRKGANVNTKDNDGYQPLHWAALNGHTEVVKLLVDRGAEINGKNIENQTPLHIATLYNRAKGVAILLSKNADVKTKDNGGRTPLDCIRWDEIRNIYKKFNHL